MTTTQPQRFLSEELPEKTKWFKAVVSPGLVVAFAAGVVGGLYAMKVHHFLKDEQTALLFLGSSDVVLLAVILTATTVATTFLQKFFGRLTQTSGGLATFFLPFTLTAFVSGAAALVCFGAALNVDSHVHETIKAGLFGFAAFLTTWAIAGAIWLTIIFTRKASSQRRMWTEQEQIDERKAEQAAEAKAAAPPTPGTDLAGQLERLADLYGHGALTLEEFAAAKAKAVARGWHWRRFREIP